MKILSEEVCGWRLLHLTRVPNVVQLGSRLLDLFGELDVPTPALLDPGRLDALFDHAGRHFSQDEGGVDGEAERGRLEDREGYEGADEDAYRQGCGWESDRAVGEVVGEQFVAANADLLSQFLQALVLVELGVDQFVEVRLDVELVLVLEESAEDVESLGEVAEQVVGDGDVVAEEELGEVVLAGEYLALEVLDEEGVLLADVEVQHHQPLLVLPAQVPELRPVVVLHQLHAQQARLLPLREELPVEGALYHRPHLPARLELPLVDLDALDHREDLRCGPGDLGEGADGLVVGAVSKEDLGDPEADLLLIVLELDVLLQVLEAVLDQQVRAAPRMLARRLPLTAQLTADVHRLHQHLDRSLRHRPLLFLAQPQETYRTAQVELRAALQDQPSAELLHRVVVVPQLHLHHALHVQQLPGTLLSHLERPLQGLTTVLEAVQENEDERTEVVREVV